MKEEGVYLLKRVDNLPTRGNANLLYVLKSESPIENYYRWIGGSYETLPIGATGGLESIQAGTNVTIDDTDPLNPIINATAATGGTILTLKVFVSAAKVRTLNSIAVTILPPTGAGTYIKLLGAEFFLDYGTVQFDNLVNVHLGNLVSPAQYVSDQVNAVADTRNNFIPSASGGTWQDNGGIYLTSPEIDSTVGDSLLYIYITYVIKTV